MRRILFLFLVMLGWLAAWADEPETKLKVEQKMQFGGISLKLSDDYRQLVQDEVDKLTANNRYFRASVERADAYFSIVERILDEEGVPQDFKYLCLQESKLVSDVVSTSNAVGFWQFKQATAEELGMRCDELVDERMNIVASTRGAARYLKRSNAVMNNWLYSLLSYYAGLSGAKSIVDMDQVGAQKMELGLNTHWYITKFLAHKVAYEQSVNRNPNTPVKVLEYDPCENKSLDQIAQENNLDPEELKFYNKWCRTGRVPADKDYVVLLPIAQAERPALLALSNQPATTPGADIKPFKKTYLFGLIESSQPSSTPAPPQAAAIAQGQEDAPQFSSQVPLLFTWNGIKAIMARKHDNISRLALQAGVDRDAFLKYNDMRVFDLVVPGQVYYIKAKKKKARVPFHIVKGKETMWEISQQYGVAMKHLLAKNRMDKPEQLKPGQIVWLRHTRPADRPVEYVELPSQAVPASPQPASPTVAPALPQPDSSQQDSPLPDAEDSTSIDEGNPATSPEIFIGQREAEQQELIAIVPEAQPKAQPAKPSTATENEEPRMPPVPQGTGWNYHELQVGQTLYSLSKQLSVPLDSLMAWNLLGSSSLQPGAQLRYRTVAPPQPATPQQVEALLPQPQHKADSVQPMAQATAQPRPTTYVVKPGDSLYGIARKHGVEVQQIVQWNQKADNAIKVGEELIVKQP